LIIFRGVRWRFETGDAGFEITDPALRFRIIFFACLGLGLGSFGLLCCGFGSCAISFSSGCFGLGWDLGWDLLRAGKN